MMARSTLRPALALAVLAAAPACLAEDAVPEATQTAALEEEPLVCEADLAADPLNCGACGTVCASGLCYAGWCADDRAGHVFVIGHAYRTSNPALDRLLGNAVFLPATKPARVVTWAGPGTTPELVTRTNDAIRRGAAQLRESWKRYNAPSSAAVPVLLANADVFLVYAQPHASDATLQALGGEWALALDDFTRRGGIVIVLDAPGANAGTVQVLAASGLLALEGRAPVSGVAFVAAHADVAAAQVPLMFAIGESIGFAPSGWTDVAATETGSVVAVHRAIY